MDRVVPEQPGCPRAPYQRPSPTYHAFSTSLCSAWEDDQQAPQRPARRGPRRGGSVYGGGPRSPLPAPLTPGQLPRPSLYKSATPSGPRHTSRAGHLYSEVCRRAPPASCIRRARGYGGLQSRLTQIGGQAQVGWISLRGANNDEDGDSREGGDEDREM